MIGLILLGAVAAIVVWAIGIYNGLVKLKNRTDEAWSDIDVQLKRRYDLIPNLVNTVKGYAKHEEEVFENVTKARNMAVQAEKSGDPREAAQAENMLSGTLKTLFAVAEAYPELKANENFMELQHELSDTEDKIQASRRFYNGNVRDLNTKIEMFPGNIVAGIFNFAKREFFEIENAEERQNVTVNFNSDKDSK